MAMFATNRFAGDGVTTSYEFNFAGKYIARSHVKAYQEDNATLERTPVAISDSNFLNDTTLRNLPVTPAGKTLVIYRDTPKAPMVDFVNGARFTEANLDTATRQGSFIAVESADALSTDGLAGFINQIEGFSSAAETARDLAVTSASTATTKAAEALASEVAAEFAKDDAIAAAGAIGPIKFYGTHALATAALGSLANGDLVEVAQDETRAEARTRYVVSGGALVFAVNLDQLRLDLADPEKGAAMIVSKQPGAGTVTITQAEKNSELVTVKSYGARGDGSDQTVQLQLNATRCDGDLLSYMCIPNRDEAYKISAAIVFNEPGVRIFGFAGPTYNRGTKKLGWIETSEGVSHAFDLGNSRTTGNPADNWEMDHIKIRPAEDVTQRITDGVRFTMRRDGPDRGGNLESMSFYGLRDAVTVENPDISTTLANLSIEKSVFRDCISAVNAKGRTLGLRFVGNQCEQNAGTNGVIRGFFHGTVHIEDNMLEGQPNVISIDIPPTYGNSISFTCKHNYFEANTGAYVMRFRNTTPNNTYEIGPNYVTALGAADYILFEDTQGSALVTNKDPFPVTFNRARLTVNYGSDIFSGRVREYKIRQLNSKSPEIIIKDWEGFSDSLNDHVHAFPYPSSAQARQTPAGPRLCAVNGAFFPVNMPVAAGDLFVLNVLCMAEVVTSGNFNPQVYNQNQTAVVTELGDSGIAAQLAGRWALVSIPFIAQTPATSLNFRLIAASGSFTSAIAGITAKNYGPHVNDGSVAKLIRPVAPNFTDFAPGYIVANLPTATTARRGDRAMAIDATVTTFMSVVVGGGANIVPVLFDGTNWKIG